MIDKEFKMDGAINSANCQVQIYAKCGGTKYEVILTEPKESDYKGVSTTNFFEKFATGIKDKFLKEVSAESIEWFDLLKWKNPGFEDQKVRVELTWNGSSYINPEWKGAVA